MSNSISVIHSNLQQAGMPVPTFCDGGVHVTAVLRTDSQEKKNSSEVKIPVGLEEKLPKNAIKIMRDLHRNPTVKGYLLSGIAAVIEMNSRQTRYALSALRAHGLIEKIGSNRNSRHRLSR